LFKPRGLIVVDKAAIAEDALIEAALEAGAEDVATEGEGYEIQTAPAQLETVRESLTARGIAIQSAESLKLASLMVPVDERTAEQLLRLVDALEDHDDVQKVYANFTVPDEIMTRLAR
jgi:transcriptional/translational regulatory protein YebC/TACO1